MDAKRDMNGAEETSGDARRAYWTQQMERGYDVVQDVLRFPVEECGEPFASLLEAAATAGVEMQFSETKIAGTLERVFFMRESLVRKVVDVGRALDERGWILKIEDAYRSLEMQRQLVLKPAVFDAILQKCIWECGGRLPPVDLVARRSIVLIANIPKIGTHMSGSAIDISVVRRAAGAEVWRGDPYLHMSERTPMRSPFVEPDALTNRLAITAVLEAHGFIHFPFEFWHYNQHDALGHVVSGKPGPARFGPVDWDPATNRVERCADPLRPLNALDIIECEIEAALERARRAGSPKAG